MTSERTERVGFSEDEKERRLKRCFNAVVAGVTIGELEQRGFTDTEIRKARARATAYGVDWREKKQRRA